MTAIVKHRHSNVAGKIPTTTQLNPGEICVNTTDGVLYIKTTEPAPAETEKIERFLPESLLPFSIPQLSLKTGVLNYDLFTYWNSKDALFLNHSPQIFLFRWTFAHYYSSPQYSYYSREGSHRWRHPRHLKLTDSNVYHSEFALGQKGIWTEIPIILTEWCPGDLAGEVVMYRKSRKRLAISFNDVSAKSISVHFAVAITVLDPLTQKRVWGPITPFWISCRRVYDMDTGLYKLKRLFELNK